MKYKECSCCRRANSHLCNQCQSANFLLVNDTRKFYYINCEGDHHKGPFEAYLLPYKDVWPESYVWTKGMSGWDFAGNVLDRRTLAVNYNYCPCCNGEFEKRDINLGYPTDAMEYIYKCKNCGFEFSYGATRMCSNAQREYAKHFYNHKKVLRNTTFIPGMEPKGTPCSCDEQKRKRDEIEHKKGKCLSVGSRIYNKGYIYEITGVNEIGNAFILYSAKSYYGSFYMKLKKGFEDIHLLELFLTDRDFRGKDGEHRVSSLRRCIDGVTEMAFYAYIHKLTNLPVEQICNLFNSKADRDFFEENNTQYFVSHKNTNRKLRLGSRITLNGSVFEAIEICGSGSYGEVLKMRRVKHPFKERITDFVGQGDWTKNQYVAIKQFVYEEVHYNVGNVLNRNKAQQLFKTEYSNLSVIRHPSVVNVYQYCDNSSIPFYVMEYIDGISLADYLGKHDALDWKEAKEIVISICEALKYCHDNGIVHGDITTNNIMIGNNGLITLIDFDTMIKRPDYLGLALIYFDLLTKQYFSIPNLYISPRKEIEYAQKILHDRHVPESITSHILYIFDSAGISNKAPTIDFLLDAIKTDTILPYYKKRFFNKMFSNSQELGKTSTFTIFQQGSKFGMRNKEGQIVIPPIYDAIRGIENMFVPGPGPGLLIAGAETKRGDMTGWYELNDNMELKHVAEATSDDLRHLSRLT